MTTIQMSEVKTEYNNVQDKKTGLWYNPEYQLSTLIESKEFRDIMTRCDTVDCQ